MLLYLAPPHVARLLRQPLLVGPIHHYLIIFRLFPTSTRSVPGPDDNARLTAPTIQHAKFKFLGTMSCTMSHTLYSSLPLEPGSIRLLRLMPDKDETALIQCQLFNYSPQESGEWTHLYEALSYVWGDPDKTLPILINEHCFNITVNLYAALLRLRNRSFERIIWVDAVCINQGCKQEKERQIQSMAKICGQANRVIIWLGETADNSDRALEEIRVAPGMKSTNSLNGDAIPALLQRPWFRRIWVRQQTLDNICRNY